MSTFFAALGFECLKLRRSVIAWVSAAVLVVVVPLAATGMLFAARSEARSQLAVKARTMVTGTGWDAHITATGQILSAAALVVVGIVACWIFGREFTDRTLGALLSLPVSRGRIAAAKFAVLLGWGLAVTAAIAVTTLVTGLAAGLGPPGTPAWTALGKLVAAVLLTIALTTPLPAAATAGRGYLTGIAILLALLAVTQLAVAAGIGAWFPYAAPGLWLGMGGPEAAARVAAAQLLLPLPVSLAGAWATVAWWNSRRLSARV